MKKLLSLVAILSLVFSPVTPAFTAERKWLGLSLIDNNFSSIGNWWGSRPSDGDALLFSTVISGRDVPMNNYVGYEFSKITFRDSAKETELRGNGIYLSGDIDNSSNKYSQTISLNMELLQSVNLYSGDGSRNLEIGGVISGGYGITKYDSSILILGGANTYTGSTTISDGTLRLGVSGAIPAGSAVTLLPGGTLSLYGYNDTIAALSGSGKVNNGSATNATLTAGDATSTTFSGTLIDGAAGKLALTKQGSGSLTLTGINAYTGTTTISAGTLQIGSGGTAGTLSTSSAIVDNATLSFNRTNAVTQGIDFAPVISGTGAVTQAGTGTLILSGANTYSGATNVNAGVLDIRHNTATGTTAGGVFVASGAALQLQNNISVGAEALTLNGTGISSDGALRNINGNNSWAGTITLGSTVRINSDSGTLTLSGNIGGAGRSLRVGGDGNTTISGAIGTTTGTLSKDDSGTLLLSGANTYTGLTSVGAGMLKLGSDSALGTTALGTTVASGASLDLNGRDLYAAGKHETLELAGTGLNSAGALLNSAAGMASYSGAITLTSDSTIKTDAGSMIFYGNINNNGNGLTFDGSGTISLLNTYGGDKKITGGGILVKSGSGALNLFMTGSDYTGKTFIDAGTLALGAEGVLPDSGAVEIAAGAYLDLNGQDETLGSLAGAGTVSNTAGACTLTAGGDNTSTVFSGIIENGSTGNTSLTKAGSGTLTLSGANTYAGITTLSAGTLALGNNLALQNSTLDTAGAGVMNATGFTTPTFGGLTGGKNLASVITTGYGNVTGITLNPGSGVSNTYSGVIANGAAGMTLTKSGAGTQILSGANTYTGATTVSAGTLTLDYSTQDNSKISGTAALTLGGGTLDLSGGTYTQGAASTTLSAGDSFVTRSSGTAVLQMNTITVNDGATIDFSAANIAKTNNNNNSSGILGTWATINGTDWAMKDAGAGANGFVIAFNGYNNIAAKGGIITDGADQVRINYEGTNGNITLSAGTTTIKTLLQNTVYDATVDTAGKTFRADGIMIGEGMGALTIGAAAGNGTLTSATLNGDIGLINYSNSKQLIINAVIADNGTASTLTKAGDGTLVLNGINTYTGATRVSGGTLNLNQNLSASSELAFEGNATVNLAGGVIVTPNITTDLNDQGVLNFLGDGSVLGQVGGANVLKEINVQSGAGETAAFSGAAKATTVTVSGAGKAQFGGALTSTVLNITSTGEAEINADSSVTTTTVDAGTLDLNANITGTTLTFTGDGDVVLAGTKNITAAIANTSGSDNKGNLTTEGASVITGTVGGAEANERFGSVNISGAGTARITGAVYATDAAIGAGELESDSDADITTTTIGAGTFDLDGNLTGTTLTFTGDGFVVVADTKNITAAITNTALSDNKGNLTTEGNSVITGTVGGAGANERFGSLAINGLVGTTARITGAIYATDATIGAGELESDSDANITTTTVGAGTLNLDGSLTGTTLTFTGDGTTVVADTKNITATITNTAGANNRGNLTTEGDSVITGTVGGAGVNQRFGSLAINGARGTTAQITGAVYATDASLGAGTLKLDSNSSITTTTLANTGTLELNATLTGAVNNAGYLLTVTGAGSGEIDGVIGGAGGLTKTDAGTLTLSGGAANTYAGLTTVSEGSLLLNKTAGTDAIAGNITLAGC